MKKSLFDQIEDSLSDIAAGSSCRECGGEYGSYHAKQIIPKVKKLRAALKSLQRYEDAIVMRRASAGNTSALRN